MLTALTLRELNGQSCIVLDDPELPSLQILSSRSSFTVLSDKIIIKQAVIFHINRAHQRLTGQRLLCAAVYIPLYQKIQNTPYKKRFPCGLVEYAADDLLELSHACLRQINVLFKENINI
ncbi:MAG: hypothetical protein WB445_02765 [Acinetobacter sp.]